MMSRAHAKRHLNVPKSAPFGPGAETALAQVVVLRTFGSETSPSAAGEVLCAMRGVQCTYTASARNQCYTAIQATHTITVC